MKIEPFMAKHYVSQARPTIYGNGFDGLEVGETREEAEEFVKWINSRLSELVQFRADEERDIDIDDGC